MVSQGSALRKILAGLFCILGVGLIGAAGWTAYRQYTILNSWPMVEAEVLTSQVTQHRDSEGDVMYRAVIIFRYTVNGEERTTPTMSNYASSSYDEMKAKVDTFAPGTRHLILHNPVDPGDVRFDAAYSIGFFFAPILLGGMGLVFIGVGAAVLVVTRSTQQIQCPSCGGMARSLENVCPCCGAHLR